MLTLLSSRVAGNFRTGEMHSIGCNFWPYLQLTPLVWM